MANVVDIAPTLDTNFVDARGAATQSYTNTSVVLGNLLDTWNTDATYYFTNSIYMTSNDLVFALRTLRDAAGFVPSGTTASFGTQSIESEPDPEPEALSNKPEVSKTAGK